MLLFSLRSRNGSSLSRSWFVFLFVDYIADFPSLESERTDTPHHNSSAIDSLMSCLIPENEAEGMDRDV